MPRRRPLPVLGRLVAFVAASALAGLVVGVILLPFAGGIGVATRDTMTAFEQLPDNLETPPLPQQTVILAADGSVLATVYYENRVEVPITAVSPAMRQAIVAIEDSRFLDHNGIDLRGTLRALATNTSAGGVQQGGSTLTQQYVKNVLISSATTAEEVAAARERTPVRKLREIRYALALERRFTKDQILERYLNIAYFGAGAYGVEAAARRYFDKPASALTLVEAATLAGIVQQPTAYDPTRNPDLSELRRNAVLRRMAELGYISAAESQQAQRTPMDSYLNATTTPNGCTSSYAPFFCDYVLRTIRTDPSFGATAAEREAFLKRGGLTIRTTLDPKAQQAAFDSVTSYIPIKDLSRRAAAIAMVEPGTGRIKAMAQNRTWGIEGRGNTTYNYAVDAAAGGTIGMQAGSTFKVFTMAAALESGISPFEEVDAPSPKTWENFTNCTTGAQFPPVTIRNSTASGTFNMLEATAYSVNTYFVELASRIGLCRQAEIAEGMGVRLAVGDPLNRVPTFSLGTMEVTPLSMASAYATFANHGIYCPPTPIIEIRDRDGNLVQVPPKACRQVISRDVADTVTALLTRVIDGTISGRTGADMSLDRPAAGKTGTTNDSAAVWFSGFTPNLAASVWVGDPRGGYRYPMKDVTIDGVYYEQIFGRTFPGPIWRDAMLGALAGTPPVGFDLIDQWSLGPARSVSGEITTDPSIPLPDVPVPNVVGKLEAEAVDALFVKGFDAKVEYRDDPGEPGIVLEQTPAADTEAESGSEVILIVSQAASASPSPSPSGSASPSPSPSPTPSGSGSPSPSPSPTASATASPRSSPSARLAARRAG